MGGCQRPAILFRQFLVTGVLNLAAGLVVERGEVTARGLPGAFGAILFCGILSVGVGFTFQILGQKHASNPTFAAIILSSESVFSIIGALLWNRFTPESLHVSQDIQPLGYVGCACIPGGNRAFPAEFPESGENGCAQQYRASCWKIDRRQELT